MCHYWLIMNKLTSRIIHYSVNHFYNLKNVCNGITTTVTESYHTLRQLQTQFPIDHGPADWPPDRPTGLLRWSSRAGWRCWRTSETSRPRVAAPVVPDKTSNWFYFASSCGRLRLPSACVCVCAVGFTPPCLVRSCGLVCVYSVYTQTKYLWHLMFKQIVTFVGNESGKYLYGYLDFWLQPFLAKLQEVGAQSKDTVSNLDWVMFFVIFCHTFTFIVWVYLHFHHTSSRKKEKKNTENRPTRTLVVVVAAN